MHYRINVVANFLNYILPIFIRYIPCHLMEIIIFSCYFFCNFCRIQVQLLLTFFFIFQQLRKYLLHIISVVASRINLGSGASRPSLLVSLLLDDRSYLLIHREFVCDYLGTYPRHIDCGSRKGVNILFGCLLNCLYIHLG